MTCFKDSVSVITAHCVHVLRFNACKMDDPNTISVVCHISPCHRIQLTLMVLLKPYLLLPRGVFLFFQSKSIPHNEH